MNLAGEDGSATAASEVQQLRAQLRTAEETLRAIRNNEVDALVIGEGGSERVYTLRGADEAYRIFVEVMHQGAATIGTDGTILYCNRAFAELLSTPLELTIGDSVYSMIAAEDEGTLRALLWEAMSGAAVTRPFQLRNRDDRAVSVMLTAAPLCMQEQHLVCLVVTDLTEHEALMASEAAHKAKDRFLATLSHELRTPLMPVVMTAAALADDPAVPPHVRKDLETVRRNVELEAKLIDDLLDLSRITTGKLALQRRRLDLHELLHAVLDMLASDFRQRSIRLTVQLEASNAQVAGDPARLQQVLWNVLKNAVKFSHPGGPVAVTTSSPDPKTVQIRVSDEGVGIDQTVLPRIFNAFEQADDSRAAGLGLGLAIARALVEMHDGTIVAESEGLSRGASFVINLPIVGAPAEAATRSGRLAAPDGERPKPLRLLVVEDHLDTATILGKLLRQFGHEIRIAHCVKDALALVGTETFDAVVSDIGLPDGTGHDLMRQIRCQCPIPGIALTGYGMEDDVLRSRDAGFVDHVVKPVNARQLQAVLARATRHG